MGLPILATKAIRFPFRCVGTGYLTTTYHLRSSLNDDLEPSIKPHIQHFNGSLPLPYPI